MRETTRIREEKNLAHVRLQSTTRILNSLALASVLVILAAPFIAHAGAWEARRAALDKFIARDGFRVFYTLSGADALPQDKRADVDSNGIPDVAQDALLQVIVADQLYRDVLGLRSPLAGPRYSQIKHIDIHLLGRTIENDPQLKGMSYDGIIDFKRPLDRVAPVKSLGIDLAVANIPARNLTAAHELFHAYQNGYTMYKNRWFTEGTARWIESAFHAGSGSEGTIPKSTRERDSLFATTYEASGFWRALARRADAAGTIRIPPDLLGVRYVAGGNPIIEDTQFYGANWIRFILEEMDAQDDVTSAREGLDPFAWEESRQKSSQNDIVIWEAIKSACRKRNVSVDLP